MIKGVDKMNNKDRIRVAVILTFVTYCIILLKVIVFKYPRPMIREILASWNLDLVYRNFRSANFLPFRTIIPDLMTFNSYNLKVAMYNIIAFMPMGFFLPIITNRVKNIAFTIIIATAISLIIESIQLITVLGSFDVDDILLNAIGAIFGFIFYLIFIKKKRSMAKGGV